MAAYKGSGLRFAALVMWILMRARARGTRREATWAAKASAWNSKWRESRVWISEVRKETGS